VNLKGAFLADSEIVANKNILLIDDIVTTASTLNACALELKNKGAKNVYCAAISTTILIDSQKNTKNI
jgi:predicted amidophosphoribosyltransferase